MSSNKSAVGQLLFFCHWHDKLLHQKKFSLPLLSMKTTETISLEHVAKPLKNGVLEKWKHKSSVQKQIQCLRQDWIWEWKQSWMKQTEHMQKHSQQNWTQVQLKNNEPKIDDSSTIVAIFQNSQWWLLGPAIPALMPEKPWKLLQVWKCWKL